MEHQTAKLPQEPSAGEAREDMRSLRTGIPAKLPLPANVWPTLRAIPEPRYQPCRCCGATWTPEHLCRELEARALALCEQLRVGLGIPEWARVQEG
ncbi:MAG: hypothetical protein Q7O66_13825 [Dehalococcoidia bacterium]|nr:hypothetical protein [Dehalococcoidia bacterium]